MIHRLIQVASFTLFAGTCLLAHQKPARAGESAPPKAASLDETQRIVHFLNRFTLGATPALVSEVKTLGMKAWLEEQFKAKAVEPQYLRDRLGEMGSLELSASQIEENYIIRVGKDAPVKERKEAQALENIPPRELSDSIIYRGVYSTNQVREMSADFFRNHFAVSLEKGPVKLLAVEYERTVIRANVLGSFAKMLEASAHHPAMLFYLDNCLSCRPATPEELEFIKRRGKNDPERIEQAQQRGLNENYARELLELHTLGVDNYYTQADVIEVAKCLTGWGIAPKQAAKPFVFWFRRDFHCSGDKTVLGKTIKGNPEKPQAEGEEVLTMLAAHEGTARFIAWKLCRWLVNDEPSEAMVKRIAAVFAAKQGDLPAVYLAIFDDPEFFAYANFQSKYKRPFEFLVSALRSTGAVVDDTQELHRALQNMSEPLYRCANPTGYYDHAEAWQDPGAMSLRWKFALDLANGKIRGARVPQTLYDGLDADKPASWKAVLASRILCVPLSDATSRALDAFVERHVKENGKAKIKDLGPELVAGLLGSPEFQKQ